MPDFSKYGKAIETTPTAQETASPFSKYGTPVSAPTQTSTLPKKPSVGKVTSAVGGASEGLGATLPLMAIDAVMKNVVHPFMSEEHKKNYDASPSQVEQYQTMMGKKDNPNTYGVSEVAGTVGGLVAPVKQGLGLLKNIPAVRDASLAKEAIKLKDTAGAIVQGGISDVEKAKKAIGSIDIKDIKTYADLKKTLGDKIDEGAKVLDTELEKSSVIKNLNDLGHEIKLKDATGAVQEGASIKHNFVQDALEQLENHYAKINDQGNLLKIKQIKEKADGVYDATGNLVKKGEGLTIKELNDVARMHGKDLNAFNANGELASGLSKQAAENTRMGLKDTARTLFGDKKYEAMDEELSNLIRTKQLAEDMAEKVNTLKQKVVERGFGAKAGHALFNLVDKVTGGGFKGFVQAAIPRGNGDKVLNAMDLEKNLAKNLKTLQSLLDGNHSEAEFVKKLEGLVGDVGFPKKPALGKVLQTSSTPVKVGTDLNQ